LLCISRCLPLISYAALHCYIWNKSSNRYIACACHRHHKQACALLNKRAVLYNRHHSLEGGRREAGPYSLILISTICLCLLPNGSHARWFVPPIRRSRPRQFDTRGNLNRVLDNVRNLRACRLLACIFSPTTATYRRWAPRLHITPAWFARSIRTVTIYLLSRYLRPILRQACSLTVSPYCAARVFASRVYPKRV